MSIIPRPHLPVWLRPPSLWGLLLAEDKGKAGGRKPMVGLSQFKAAGRPGWQFQEGRWGPCMSGPACLCRRPCGDCHQLPGRRRLVESSFHQAQIPHPSCRAVHRRPRPHPRPRGGLGRSTPQSPLPRPPLASPASLRVQLKPNSGLTAAEGRAAGWECSVPGLLKVLQNQCLSAHFPPNRLDTRQEATALDAGSGRFSSSPSHLRTWCRPHREGQSLVGDPHGLGHDLRG